MNSDLTSNLFIRRHVPSSIERLGISRVVFLSEFILFAFPIAHRPAASHRNTKAVSFSVNGVNSSGK
jgi:hypothetical protein